MAGICGIVSGRTRENVTPEGLRSMVAALGAGSHEPAPVLCWTGAGFGEQPFPGRVGGIARAPVHGAEVVVALHGSLFETEDLSIPFSRREAATGVLELYLQAGLQLLDRLYGEFALAIWDGREEVLHVATDRFRVHSLLYRDSPEQMVFASRMTAIERCPVPLGLTVSPTAIIDVAGGSFIPSPHTVYREVKKLPPGHVLSWRNGVSTLSSYWDIDFTHPDHEDEPELARRLKSHFSRAMSVRVRQDMPGRSVGTFLSGGVDSSTVTGVLTQVTGAPVTSFSIGFGVDRFNEIAYARIAARAFESKHVEYFVTPDDVFEAIPQIVHNFDEPFANASAVPTYFCSKVAREHGVDTLYAGDGGDELFAGNERYAAQRLFDYYQDVPSWIREPLLKPLVFGMAAALPFGPFLKAKKYIQRAMIPYPDRLYSYGIYKILPMEELFQSDFLRSTGVPYNPFWAMHYHWDHSKGLTKLDRQLYLDLKLAISDNDLFKVTRMTEANGVLVRYPFLDQYLAEFASRVPSDIRMRGRRLRSFFKQAYSDVLPREILTKTKHGFGLPIPVWLRTDKKLNDLMHDLILSPRSVQRGVFAKRSLQQVVKAHATDQTSFYGTLLWNLMVIELWCRSRTERAG